MFHLYLPRPANVGKHQGVKKWEYWSEMSYPTIVRLKRTLCKNRAQFSHAHNMKITIIRFF